MSSIIYEIERVKGNYLGQYDLVEVDMDMSYLP